MSWQPRWSTFVPRFGVSVAENLTLSQAEGVQFLELYWRQFFRQRTPEFGAALREVWAGAGVTIDSLHGPHGAEGDLASADPAARAAAVTLWEELLAPFAATGCRVVVVHPSAGPTPRDERPAAAQRLVESLRRLAPQAAALGVRLALENLGPGRFGSRAEELLTVLEAVGSPALGICFDTGHAHLAGRLLALHEALAARIVHYHISDNDQVTDRHQPPPYGTIPWRPFWSQVAALGPAQPLLLEVPPTRHQSVSQLRELASAVVRTCLTLDEAPRLCPPGQQQFVKDPATGEFVVYGADGKA